MNAPLLTLDRLTKRFPGPVTALDDVSLAVDEGELLVLMGPSGSGKTTLLRLVAGLEPPTAGRVALGGRDLAGVAPRHRQLAMIFQSAPLYPHLSVRRNLAFGLRMGGVSRAERNARIETMAAMTGVAELLTREPGALSGGQRQRVALARALLRSPRLLLLDEPLAHLDASARQHLRQEIHALHARLGATMLYVTHDAAEAMALGQRVAVLHEGRLLQIDAPPAMYDRPANRVVAAIFATRPMNFIAGRCRYEDGQCCFRPEPPAASPRAKSPPTAADVIALPTALAEKARAAADGRVVLGLRAEGLQAVGGRAERFRAEGVRSNAADDRAAANGNRADAAGLRFAARVESVEWQGDERLVSLAGLGQSLLAVLAAAAPVAVGETIELAADRVHLFDAASGAAL